MTFYATDAAFAPVADMIRSSGKTYDTFRVAQTFLADPERLVFLLRKNPDCKQQFHRSAFDGVPFSSADGALNHLMRNYLGRIFEKIEEECEAPGGNFPQVARCPFTKEIIGAPNHHSYRELLNEHYLQHEREFNMPFELYCERIEFTKESEAIASWLERMKKRCSYRLKNLKDLPRNDEAADDPDVDQSTTEPESAKPQSEGGEPVETARQEEVKIFKSLGDVRAYLMENADRFLRKVDSVRVNGSDMEAITDKDIRDFIEYCWDRQKRFPLDTANAMRGKFKRYNLHSYKLGKHGPSYVAPVARKLRDGSVVFTPLLERLITVIEENSRINPLELCVKIGMDGDERDEMLKALSWLRGEGYVTEFEDGTLLVHGKTSTQESDSEKNKKRQAGENSKGVELDHLSHGEEHGSGDDGNGTGEDEDRCRLEDCGDAVDAIAQLLFKDVGGVCSHGGESSTTLADGDEAPDGGGDCADLSEEFAQVDALAGADGNGLEVVAELCVGDCSPGETEGLGEGDSIAEDGAESAKE